MSRWRPRVPPLLGGARREARRSPRVHVKHDTRHGPARRPDPRRSPALVGRPAADERVELAGLLTHFATADEPESTYSTSSSSASRRRGAARASTPTAPARRHSAATLRDPASHFDMVRCGIAVYGLDPFHEDPWRASSSRRWRCAPTSPTSSASRRGERGLRAALARAEPTRVGVLPIGYGDGSAAALTNNADVLVGGALPARRHGLDGQHHDRPRRRTDAAAVGGDPDRRPGRPAITAEEVAAASARSTTRSHAGSLPACGASTSAAGRERGDRRSARRSCRRFAPAARRSGISPARGSSGARSATRRWGTR